MMRADASFAVPVKLWALLCVFAGVTIGGNVLLTCILTGGALLYLVLQRNFRLAASYGCFYLLLALLLARVIKTEHIREKSDYLLGNLPFFFIPACVSIINYADVLRENLLALVVVCAVSLIATFAATVGAVRLTCRLLERGKRR